MRLPNDYFSRAGNAREPHRSLPSPLALSPGRAGKNGFGIA